MAEPRKSCQHCGKFVMSGMRKCPACGSDLYTKASVSQSQSLNTAPKNDTTKVVPQRSKLEPRLLQRSNTFWTLAAGVGLVAVLLVGTEEIKKARTESVLLPDGYGGVTMVDLVYDSGVLVVPLNLPDGSEVHAVVDSGASDVSLPNHVVSRLLANQTISRNDYLGTRNYRIADGSIVESDVYVLRTLQVGDLIVEGVTVSVAEDGTDPLLGQSFFKRFGSWSIDNNLRKLRIVPRAAGN